VIEIIERVTGGVETRSPAPGVVGGTYDASV
jgi:hypothetical protein